MKLRIQSTATAVIHPSSQTGQEGMFMKSTKSAKLDTLVF